MDHSGPKPLTPNLQRGLRPELLKTISDAAAWCSIKQFSITRFRSPELDPTSIINIPEFSSGSESIEAWIEKKRDCYRQAVHWVNQTRSELLKTTGIENLEATNPALNSLLLVYEPMETVTDGAAEAASSGFYDIEDAPPWETWFLYAGRSIFCCVPESVTSIVQAGIDANPVDCIHWANWSVLAWV